MRIRIWLARAACICLLAGVFQPFYFRFFSARQRAGFAAFAARLPFTKMPSLPAFIEGVRGRTRAGDRIAIAVPYARWDGGYAYAFTRSTYLLVGRTTVPLIDERDRQTPENLAKADYVAAWHTNVAWPGFAQVWRGPDGVLLRRAR